MHISINKTREVSYFKSKETKNLAKEIDYCKYKIIMCKKEVVSAKEPIENLKSNCNCVKDS